MATSRVNGRKLVSKEEAALKTLLKSRKSRYATVAFVDLQGQLRGKTVSVGKLDSALDEGIPFSADNFMLDFGDIKLVPEGYLTMDQDYADERCDVDWARPRILPFEDADSDLLFFVEYAEGTNGGKWDPRRLFRRTLERAEALGIIPTFAFEYEFRLFKESPETLREKGFQNPKLLNEVSTYGGVMHQSLWSQLFKDMRHICEAMDVPISSMHWEQAASMGEVALGHRPGIAALDDAILFKTHAKALAARNNMLLSFMARPLADDDGQSGHVHFSVKNARGRQLFHNPRDDNGMSDMQRHAVGGLQQLLPELLLMLAPNINSFKRLAPGAFAPIAATWGVENRTCAIRVIPGRASVQRIELRAPGSDSNPYLVATCLLASALWGIENKVEPAAPMSGSCYERADSIPEQQHFPPTFRQAIERFSGSAHARRMFGDDFVEMYAGTRLAQAEQFARMVTDKELERFLEMA
ncbi:MAG: glutamine synthetase family protein [Pseudomonadales bacterium]